MKDFYIEKIEVEGFLKYKEKTEKNFQKHLAIITGPNASGKTSLLEAIMFALFNVARVNSFKDLVHKDRKLAKITLYFSYGGEKYTLKRMIRKTLKGASTTFELYKNNVKTNLKISDMFNFFKLSPSIVKRVLYSPQQELVAILSLDKSDREKFFKEILSLDIVDRILDILKKQRQKAKDSIEFFIKEDVSFNNLKILEEELSHLKESLKKYESRINSLKRLITFFETRLGKLENLKSLLDERKSINLLEEEIKNILDTFYKKYQVEKTLSYDEMENVLKGKFENFEKDYQNVKKLLTNIDTKIFKFEKVLIALKNVKSKFKEKFENIEKEFLFLRDNIFKTFKSYKDLIDNLNKELSNFKTLKVKNNLFENINSLEELEKSYQSLKLQLEKKVAYLDVVETNLSLKLKNLLKFLKLLKNYDDSIFKEFENIKNEFEKYQKICSQLEFLNKEISDLKTKFDINLINTFVEKLEKEYNINVKSPEEILLKLKEIDENPINLLKQAKKFLKKDINHAEKLIDKAILTLELKDDFENLKINVNNYIFYLEKKKEFNKILQSLGLNTYEKFLEKWNQIKIKYKSLENEYEKNLKIKYQLDAFNLFKILNKHFDLNKIEKILNILYKHYKIALGNLKVKKENLLKEKNVLEKAYLIKKIELLKEDFKDKFKYSFTEFEDYFENLKKQYLDLKNKYDNYINSVITPINQSSLFSYDEVETNPQKFINKLDTILNIYRKLRKQFTEKQKELENYLIDKQKFERFVKLVLSLEEKRKNYKELFSKFAKIQIEIRQLIEEKKLLEKLKVYDSEIVEKYNTLKKDLEASNISKNYFSCLKIVELFLSSLENLYKRREKEYINLQREIALKEEKISFIKERLKQLEKERKKLNIIESWMTDLENYKSAIREEFLKNIPYLVSLYYSEIGFNYEIEITPDFNILVKDGNITRNVKSLSGGEKVGLALALKIALANFLNLPFLILDEPFEALDEDRLANAKAFLEKYFKNQILVATHTW